MATYWIGKVPEKDDFGKPIKDFFVDGKTKSGPWAMMTLASYRVHGVGLGLGKGQQYEKQDDGKWLKVEG
jgi:hypothetical protein